MDTSPNWGAGFQPDTTTQPLKGGVMDVEIGCMLDVNCFGSTILVWILIDYDVF